MANKPAFQIPADLEFFDAEQVEAIGHFRRSKRQQLTRAGDLVAINVGGKWLYTGVSLRAYVRKCAASKEPPGRSKSAKRVLHPDMTINTS